MKITLDWLKQHLDTSATLDEIVLALTALGLEVDAVHDRAKTYAPFTVAHVISAEKHPDADRLKCLVVDTGKEKLNVVCGAPNARAGMKGIFAPAGSYIPGTDITLKKGMIRGKESNGMMVSEREMGLSDAHEGIIEIDESIATGTAFAEIYRLNDPVIEIGLTPNRGDCAGVRGIARDLAAAGLGTLKPLDETPVKGVFKSPIGVELQTPDCPLFLGRMIKGVKNGSSPQWLQDRLKAIGQKPISVLVDITNYMTHDLCRPLHVFDADKIKGNIHVRSARKGETLAALNDKTYELSEGMVAVCDESGVLGLGGIIGGASTGVSEETVNVYIEAACFDPLRTARTGRALQINTDARYRFERGLDPQFTVTGMEMATRMILDLCGGTASDVVTAGSIPAWQRTIEHDPAYVRKLAGFDIPVGEQKSTLSALGFKVDDKGRTWSVQPPAWRSDIEGKPDLVEEIIRIHGYDRIPAASVTKDGAVARNAETAAVSRGRKARTSLAARGFEESVTWSFMEKSLAGKFGTMDAKTLNALTIANPISSEMNFMRPSILPNLIAALGRNDDRGYPNGALCEIGPVFLSPKVDGFRQCAAGVRCGQYLERHWTSKETSRPVDAIDAKADALAVLDANGGLSPQISRDAPGYYHPGRSGTFRLGTNVIGYFGEIHPSVLEDMKVSGPMAAFEIFLDALPQAKQKGGTARPLLQLSAFQPILRDFAFIVGESVESDTLIRTVRGVDKNLIADVRLFDVYQGKGVDAGKKSVALAVTLQPQARTLTDEEIEEISRRIVDSVGAKTGGTLRK